MEREQANPTRFIGLDIHKHYLVATGVDADQTIVLDPQHVPYSRLDRWIGDELTDQDVVVFEMTTNSWEMYDALVGHVHSVTVVHPPHVRLITRAQVMTDKKASLVLAQLLAAGLLVSIWVPPIEVRDLRALIALRRKMVNLTTSIKNRLHSVLHRNHIAAPDVDQEPPALGAASQSHRRPGDRTKAVRRRTTRLVAVAAGHDAGTLPH
jgi:transposase